MDIFAGDFTDGITEGFKTADLYGDVTTSPFNMSTESSRDSKRNFRTVTCLFTVRMADRIIERIILSVNPSVKVNICPLCQLCSSSFQSQLSPTANNQPKKKNFPSSQHNKLYFLKFCGYNICILIYRRILSVFVSNSIFLNFNI